MQRCTSWPILGDDRGPIWTLLLVAGFKFQEGKFWDRSCYNFPLPSCLRTRNEGRRDVSLLTTAISRLSLQAIMLPPPPHLLGRLRRNWISGMLYTLPAESVINVVVMRSRSYDSGGPSDSLLPCDSLKVGPIFPTHHDLNCCLVTYRGR
jgi:hypothetical protein